MINKLFLPFSIPHLTYDAAHDSQKIIKANNINYQPKFLFKNLEKNPTLVAINHYTRPIFTRKSFFTTADSLISSIIITDSLHSRYKRPITWIAKSNLATNIFISKISLRDFQNEAIKNYNLIPVGKNYPYGSYNAVTKRLQEGTIICFYPEGKAKTKLQKFPKDFEKMVSYFQKNLSSLQIIPASIYLKDDIYQVTFSKPVYAHQKSARTIVDKIYNELLANLQKDLKD